MIFLKEYNRQCFQRTLALGTCVWRRSLVLCSGQWGSLWSCWGPPWGKLAESAFPQVKAKNSPAPASFLPVPAMLFPSLHAFPAFFLFFKIWFGNNWWKSKVTQIQESKVLSTQSHPPTMLPRMKSCVCNNREGSEVIVLSEKDRETRNMPSHSCPEPYKKILQKNGERGENRTPTRGGSQHGVPKWSGEMTPDSLALPVYCWSKQFRVYFKMIKSIRKSQHTRRRDKRLKRWKHSLPWFD